MKTSWFFDKVPWHEGENMKPVEPRPPNVDPRPSREGRPGDSQDMPTMPENYDGPDVQSLVIADIERRRNVGIERYGQALMPNNGRNAILDAYEETLDLCCYLRQLLLEQEL